MTEEEARKSENNLKESNRRVVRSLVLAGAVLMSVAATYFLYNLYVSLNMSFNKVAAPARKLCPIFL